MSRSKPAMCPLFPDMPCPQGQDSADACKVRMEGDLNPLLNFRDYLFINCALQRAKENEQKYKISSKPKD
ncbi:MAG: hypothetical protein JW956_05360 [Calditrichaceae bacterium]|nr:hypothetical protein [Calditrichaceae bacterium]